LLAELRRLRELQVAQADALATADLERLSLLDGERRRLQARIQPGDAPPLTGADLAEARALVDLLRRDQEELAQRAAAARDAMRGELGSLRAGRSALAGYRPPADGHSLYLDRSR
jgi:hypothetical protein